MLVLARKSLETIRIGDQITISIVSIKGRIVRVGIEAPAGIRIMRGELLDGPSTASPGDSAAAPAGAVPLAEPSAEDRSSGAGQLQPIALEAFEPAPRLTTQHVNRVLSLRRPPRRMNDRLPRPAVAVS